MDNCFKMKISEIFTFPVGFLKIIIFKFNFKLGKL